MLKALALVAVVAGAAVTTPTRADAATVIVNVSGARAEAGFRGGGNTVQSVAIGAGSRVTAIAYAVTITANAPSFLSEATVALTGSGPSSAGVLLSPGIADDTSGTASYAGDVDLVGQGLDFTVGSDGILRLEYFDSFVDGAGPDSVWDRGSLTVSYAAATAAVPEPATWAMLTLGFGCVGGAVRRRRSSLAVACLR